MPGSSGRSGGPVTPPTPPAVPKPGSTDGQATQEQLYFEDFDGVAAPAGFTHDLPEGWEGETQGVHSGEARWNGWTLSTIRNWTWASGTEKRNWFTRAHDNVAIIDSKQQRLSNGDSMTAAMRTPAIDVAGRSEVEVSFDSHYRQGKEGQKAHVFASFDAPGEGGRKDIVTLDADRFSSREAVNLPVPTGAKSLTLEFVYADGNDDWYWAVDNVAVRTPLSEPTGEPKVIDVISDIQGDIADYEDAVGQLNALPDPAKALVINGDAVDGGDLKLWEEFAAARARAPHASGQTFMTAGNHEMYGKEGSEAFLNRFYQFSGSSKPVEEHVVDGVPIITISSEYYSDVLRDGKEPFVRLSKESLDYLDERLAHWDSLGVTPLVFSHYLLPQTVSMSHSAWYQNDYEDLQAFSNVLSKYNNLVMFTSHSHSSLFKQHDWWGQRRYDGTGQAGRRGFPVVNTGAILNEYMPDGDNDEEILPGRASSGLRVKVYPDRVRVEAYDFVTKQVVKTHDFTRI